MKIFLVHPLPYGEEMQNLEESSNWLYSYSRSLFGKGINDKCWELLRRYNQERKEKKK